MQVAYSVVTVTNFVFERQFSGDTHKLGAKLERMRERVEDVSLSLSLSLSLCIQREKETERES